MSDANEDYSLEKGNLIVQERAGRNSGAISLIR